MKLNSESIVMILTLLFWGLVFLVVYIKLKRPGKNKILEAIQKDRQIIFDNQYNELVRWVDMPDAPKEFVMSLFAEISKDPASRKADNRERLSVLEAEFMKKNELKTELTISKS
jgi:hypothetical protein